MIHHIFANRSNVGDWLSAQGIQRLLAPLPVREYRCDEPFVAETISQLSANVASDDLIIIGGGGLFSQYFNPFWEAFSTIADRAPYCIWGVGCCDSKLRNSLPPLKLVEPIVMKSRLCVVRDELTRQFLTRCNLPSPVPCPTLNVVETKSTASTGLLHVDHYDNIGAYNFEIIARMTEDYAAHTGRICRTTNNLISDGNHRELEILIGRYRDAELVVTSRLHGCIIGLASGCKVLAVSGDRKIESFMQAAGLGEWVCDLGEIENLPAMIEKLPTQISSRSFIDTGCRLNREVAESIKSHLVKGSGPPR